MHSFVLHPANDFIWNHKDFVDFLIKNQGQSILVDTCEEGVDLQEAGVYQLLDQFGYNDVIVRTNNLIESHAYYCIKFKNPCKFFKINYTDYLQYHSWTKQKLFGVLYNRPLWHRIGLAAEMQCDYNDQTLINIRCNPNDIDQRRLFELQQLFEYAPSSAVKFFKVCKQWPIQLETVDGYTVGNTTNGHTDQLASFYPDFLIDIVAETWSKGNCFFPTEKTVRPMLLKKPMIVMGPKNYLVYLRQMGFRTFYEFWDEDYDGYEDDQRYYRILDLINSISKKSLIELENLYTNMKHILDHNYRLLVDNSWNGVVTPI